MSDKPEVLLADASVLIDYVDTDIEILGLVATRFASLIVPRPVLEQVPRLSLRECSRLGIVVLEPETELQVQAGGRSEALGFRDTLCLVLCETHGWTCVTNDSALSRACQRSGVQVRRGLSLMIDLVANGHLDPGRALSVARAIHQINSFITDTILEEFEGLLRGNQG